MTDDVFIQPLALSDFTISPSGDSPGFGQLVRDVLGDSASSLDGFDAAVTDTATIVDALDKALGEQDAALDAVLVSLSQTDPAPLDQSMQGYASTFSTGAGLVSDAQNLGVPDLLTMPISPSFGGVVGPPPIQKTIDLGTHKVGDAVFTYQLGTFQIIDERVYRWLGVITAQLSHGDPRIFGIRQVITSVQRDPNGKTTTGYDELEITPAIAGDWIAQVFGTGGMFGTGTIFTFTLKLTP